MGETRVGTSDEEIDRLLGKLTPHARALLLSGATTWRTRAEPAVGLRELVMSDGPAGVRGEAWDERNTSVLLPSASALAATWDEALVERLGGLLAAEALRKGVDVLLAPTLNLHRSPLGGRHFECLSEDPELTGRIGAALVRGVQAHGVAATAKHYVANDSETDRLTVDVRVGERALREVYLAPFEAAVAAGVRLVMAGYNAVNGTTMTANALLTDPLKSEWGFDGVVVSDWGAVRGTVDTARAGLDLAMPGPDGPWGEALARAVTDGDVPEAAVDDKARRLLRLAAWLGALGGHDAPPPGAPDKTVRRAGSATAARRGGPLGPGRVGPGAPSSGVERVLGPVLPPGAGFASASAPSPGAEVWPGGVSPSGAEGPSGARPRCPVREIRRLRLVRLVRRVPRTGSRRPVRRVRRAGLRRPARGGCRARSCRRVRGSRRLRLSHPAWRFPPAGSRCPVRGRPLSRTRHASATPVPWPGVPLPQVPCCWTTRASCRSIPRASGRSP
ncbi:Beta-hexosaminidase [Streptomyces violaceorubidus]